jgi:DNA-binding transcriptional LysR family regulator
MDVGPRYPGDLIEHLRAFSALAALVRRRERAAFTRVAQQLALDVSVLRRRIQMLEAFFGGPLLAGRGNALLVTPLGERIADDGGRALALVERMRKGDVETRKRLRVGCTGTILSEVLPPILRDLKHAHRDLEPFVQRRGSHAGLTMVREGTLDFAVVRAESRPRGIASAFVGRDRLWLCAAASSALATSKGKRLSPAAVAREPLIGYVAPSFTMERVLRVLEPLGAAPWIELQGKAAALAYVACGLGVAFVSALADQVPARKGVVVRDVTSWFAPATFWLVWNERPLAIWERAFVTRIAAHPASMRISRTMTKARST